MQREAIDLITKTIQEEDEIKQQAFIELKNNANNLEANIFSKFIRANRDYKNDNPDELAYVVCYNIMSLDDVSSIKNENDRDIIDRVEYYEYLGFKDILWIKDDEDDFIILKDDIYNYLFDNDPIYPSIHKKELSFQILKEEYNNIMNTARKNEHKKYNAISYTYLKAVKNKD